jgi:hypothetical protein
MYTIKLEIKDISGIQLQHIPILYLIEFESETDLVSSNNADLQCRI